MTQYLFCRCVHGQNDMLYRHTHNSKYKLVGLPQGCMDYSQAQERVTYKLGQKRKAGTTIHSREGKEKKHTSFPKCDLAGWGCLGLGRGKKEKPKRWPHPTIAHSLSAACSAGCLVHAVGECDEVWVHPHWYMSSPTTHL